MNRVIITDPDHPWRGFVGQVVGVRGFFQTLYLVRFATGDEVEFSRWQFEIYNG